jgi:hypothetical protein
VKTNTIKLHADGDITCNTHWTTQCSRMLKYSIVYSLLCHARYFAGYVAVCVQLYCRGMLSLFPTTCIGLYGHLQVCRMLLISCSWRNLLRWFVLYLARGYTFVHFHLWGGLNMRYYYLLLFALFLYCYSLYVFYLLVFSCSIFLVLFCCFLRACLSACLFVLFVCLVLPFVVYFV